MKVIFMGTPQFAVPTLEKLIQSQHEVVGVFTCPPQAQKRGMKLLESPVHNIATKHNIDIFTPKSLKTTEAQDLVHNIKADIIVVVAYGMILPKEILYDKKYGCINLHPSKLPRFRGAAPLERTIINGDRETWVCTMKMDEGLDTGDILLHKSLELDNKITLPKLHEIASAIGSELIIETVNNIDHITPLKQSKDGVKYANKLEKIEGLIDWSINSAQQIDRMVRGMNPWPGVFFEYKGEMIKLLAVEYSNTRHGYKPGMILDKFHIATIQGILKPVIIQKPGKKPISIKDFINSVNCRNI